MMRKPGDVVWHMQNNKPTEGVIYFIEMYMDYHKNPDKEHDNNADYYKLNGKIKTKYYIVTPKEIEHGAVTDLKENSTIRLKEQVYDTRKELVESLLED